MDLSAMLSILIYVFLLSAGTLCLKIEEGAGLFSGGFNLPWKDQLCYDLPSPQEEEGGGPPQPEKKHSESKLSQHPHCYFRSISTGSSLDKWASGGTCLNMLCRIDENWETLICELGVPRLPSGALNSVLVAVGLERLMSPKNNTAITSMNMESNEPVFCETQDSCKWSIPIGSESLVTVVTVNISGCEAGQVLLNTPSRPVKPRIPVNLSHFQTIKPELILQWDEPKDHGSGPLRYEVRYRIHTHPSWQVVSTGLERRLVLDLKPEVNYTMQVHCSGLHERPLWSNWSEPYHIYLYKVTYIPQHVVAHPGENVSVYCVFNDLSISANSAKWVLNHDQFLPSSQYYAVNQRVSHITLQPSDLEMYHVLQCAKELSHSNIYLEGASIDIKCQTNGDVDAMNCSWKAPLWRIKQTLKFTWAHLPCDQMERESMGEEVGEMCSEYPQSGSKIETCKIYPLRMSCHKLWLEILYHQSPIRSKPIYISPQYHVKPHAPTEVKAENLKSGFLNITWKPPHLYVDELQCRFRLNSAAPPEWKLYGPVTKSSAVVPLPDPDICKIYTVQVTCKPKNLTGYWSDWSDFVYSKPPNSSDGQLTNCPNVSTRGDPSAYTTFLIIALLSLALFVSLVLSQNQVKRFVWKDVPNPKKCSWAKGLNFKKADTLFQPSDVMPAWPLLLPSENISKVVIMEKGNLSVLSKALVQSPLMSPTQDIVSLRSFLDGNQNMSVGSEALLVGIPHSVLALDSSTTSSAQLDELQLVDPSPSITENSAQSSVTYASVLITNPKQEQETIRPHDRDGSGSSSTDEGNFSANNSDISGSFPGGLWELESCNGAEIEDPRGSCSYNSVEELFETSDQEDATEEKGFFLGMDYEVKDEVGEEEQKEVLLKTIIMNSDDCSVESNLTPTELLSTSTCDFSPLYMPQFRTAPYTRQMPD
ncbi:leptin receptor isoform X2 [Corythoichthys intestinalis]|uniref:leptin receptor isoform X1 n=1 Tax=Corythoichthys intestinalis TaxID=161448 RepID=UPI0025A5CB30|nr:leptin receptor isoform X1 [Corythoichthys intestinalis]XP_057698066.1 leptin receptor isoform X2 [Corythoichthys intestinalis]